MELKYLLFILIPILSPRQLVLSKLNPVDEAQNGQPSRNTFSTHLKYAMPSVDIDKKLEEGNDTGLQMDSNEPMTASSLNSVTSMSNDDEDMDLIPKTILRFKPLRLTSLTTPSPFILSSNPITVTPAITSTTTTTNAPTTVKRVSGQAKVSTISKSRTKYSTNKLKPVRITLHTLPTTPPPQSSSIQEYSFVHSLQPLITASSIKNERCPSFEQLYSASTSPMSEREPLPTSTSTRDVDEHQVQYYLDKARSGLIQFQDKVRRELNELREKESLLSDNLVKVSKIVTNNDNALNHCQNQLQTLETSVSEVYGREKDIESKVSMIEAENLMLKDRLRKLSGITIKRKVISPTAINGTISGGAVSRTRSRAVIVYKNETVATFGTIHYRMAEGDNLIKIEDMIKNVHVPISKGFDYLKIIRSGYDYKLTLANSRGNAFFDHKKFDKYYSNIPDDLKYIKTSSVISVNDNGINWIEHNTRCGFWSCFFLKPGLVETSPMVYSVRDKSLIGNLSPTTSYFDLNHFVINNGTHEEKFNDPYLDKDIDGNYFIGENDSNSDWRNRNKDRNKYLTIDLNSLEIHDKNLFESMIRSAFP